MMKNKFLNTITILLIAFGTNAQDLLPNQVPTNILEKFNQDFSKAKDIEWEKKGENFEVEFEKGLSALDNKIIYNPAGEILYHKQEITSKELPETITNKINDEFPNSRINDVEKIYENGDIIYKFEVKQQDKEWDLVTNEAGIIISKKED